MDRALIRRLLGYLRPVRLAVLRRRHGVHDPLRFDRRGHAVPGALHLRRHLHREERRRPAGAARSRSSGSSSSAACADSAARYLSEYVSNQIVNDLRNDLNGSHPGSLARVLPPQSDRHAACRASPATSTSSATSLTGTAASVLRGRRVAGRADGGRVLPGLAAGADRGSSSSRRRCCPMVRLSKRMRSYARKLQGTLGILTALLQGERAGQPRRQGLQHAGYEKRRFAAESRGLQRTGDARRPHPQLHHADDGDPRRLRDRRRRLVRRLQRRRRRPHAGLVPRLPDGALPALRSVQGPGARQRPICSRAWPRPTASSSCSTRKPDVADRPNAGALCCAARRASPMRT